MGEVLSELHDVLVQFGAQVFQVPIVVQRLHTACGDPTWRWQRAVGGLRVHPGHQLACNDGDGERGDLLLACSCSCVSIHQWI